MKIVLAKVGFGQSNEKCCAFITHLVFDTMRTLTEFRSGNDSDSFLHLFRGKDLMNF